MKVFLIERERAISSELKALLENNPAIELVGCANSVLSAIPWLQTQNCDLILTETEFADGTCFDIFDETQMGMKSVIIARTGEFAQRAFRYNVIDYLMLPITNSAIEEVLERAEQRILPIDFKSTYEPKVKDAETKDKKEIVYKKNFVVRIGDKIVILPMNDIAYFFSKDKTTYLFTFDSRQYIIDQSLDLLISWLNPNIFFRINRSFIINLMAIQGIFRHFTSRMKLQLNPPLDDEIFVSRQRTNAFLNWIDQ